MDGINFLLSLINSQKTQKSTYQDVHYKTYCLHTDAATTNVTQKIRQFASVRKSGGECGVWNGSAEGNEWSAESGLRIAE